MLIHGWPMHSATWRKVAPALRRRHRLVMVDLAGLGESGFDASTDFRFESHAERVSQAIAPHVSGAFSCMATDTGATVARYLAARESKLQRLLLLNTEMPGHRPPWIRWFQALFAVPGAGAMFSATMRWRPMLESPMGFGGCFHDLRLLDAEFRALFVEPVLNDARRREGMMRYLRGIEWKTVDALAALHPTLKCRTHLVWGRDDPTFPIERARAMCAQFAPHASLTEIADAKLLVHEERPDAVAAEALRFFSAG